jgi:hypothetical protein
MGARVKGWRHGEHAGLGPGGTTLVRAGPAQSAARPGPWIDQAVPGHDVVRAGDRLNLDRGLTVTPPVGWELVDGLLVGASTVQPGAGSSSATLTQRGVGAQLQVAPFAGDANALLSDGRGLAIEVTGAGNQLAAHTGQISSMLRSVTLAAQS